ncbi:MAG: family transposase [Phycisphaerales bacterium]|nr:family transposase [Phycisphaerales bacterium]
MDWQIKNLKCWRLAWRTEESCLELLSKVIAPTWFCQSCKAEDQWWRYRDGIFDCKSCRRRVRLQTLTIFGNSRTALPAWFEAMWHVAVGTVTSARELHEAMGSRLNFKTSQTMWRLLGIYRAVESHSARPPWRGFTFPISSDKNLVLANGVIRCGKTILFPRMTSSEIGRWKKTVTDNRYHGVERKQ